MKTMKAIVVILSLVAVLAACSTKSGTISDGVKNMQDTLMEMQKNVESNDSAKVTKNAEELEASWQKFEDDVKKDQTDLYGKVEEPLGAIQTGAKQDPLDQSTLKGQITKLNDVLKEIK